MGEPIPLSKPLKSHKGEITELTFRELTARDIVEVGASPIKVTRVGDEVIQEYRYPSVMRLASLLTGHDELVLGGMKASDFHRVTAAVVDAWMQAGE